jgi:hypothetical protein
MHWKDSRHAVNREHLQKSPFMPREQEREADTERARERSRYRESEREK